MFMKNMQSHSPVIGLLSLGISLGYSAALVMYTPVGIETQWTGEISAEKLLTYSISLGALMAGILMQIYGRKQTLQLASLALVSGSLMKGLMKSAFVHQTGHTLIGSAIGMMTPTICVFLAESPPIEPRIAVLQSTAGPIMFLGVLTSFFSSLLLPPKKLYLLVGIFSLTSLLSLLRVSESPIWLEAKSSFKRLQNSEFSASYAAYQSSKAVTLRKLAFYMALQQTCHLFYYDVAKSDFAIDVGASSFFVVVLGATPSLVFSAVVDYPRRRILIMISSIVVCITYIVAAEYEMCMDTIGTNWSWFRKHCVFINLGFGMYGLYALPWVMIVENTPARVRGIVTSVLWLTNYLMFLLWLKVYQWILPYVENAGVAIIFMMMAVVVVYFHVSFASTKLEKTLLQIEKSGIVDNIDLLSGGGGDSEDEDGGEEAGNVSNV